MPTLTGRKVKQGSNHKEPNDFLQLIVRVIGRFGFSKTKIVKKQLKQINCTERKFFGLQCNDQAKWYVKEIKHLVDFL